MEYKDIIIRREDFGSLDKLTSGSNKKIWFICQECGIGVLQSYKNFLKQKDGKLCRKCRNKHTANLPEVKEKQSICTKNNWKNPRYRKNLCKKLSNSKKEYWNNIPKKDRIPCNKTTKKEIVDMLAKDGYSLVKLYNNNSFICVCSNGHKIKSSVSKWNNGNKFCYKCHIQDRFNKLKDSLEAEGYTLINKFDFDDFKKINKCEKRFHFICPKGHKHSMLFSNWFIGHRCRVCSISNSISKAEDEIYDFISNDLGITEVERGTRSVIYPYELDIVIPSLKIAIEYNGLYWHSETKLKDKKYHLKKLEMCQEKGYRLIQIFDDEWLNKSDIVKARLKHILCKTKPVYARKCTVKEIDTKLAHNFVDNNHIQGYTGSSIKLGAFYNDELIAVMTFAKLSVSKGSKNKDNQWELSRFCCSVPVVGIASKMLEYFKRNYKWEKIISYSDRRWNTGNLYNSIGFKFVSYTKPNYWYFKIGESKRYHRFNFRKNKLFGEGTEWEIMKKNGYDRIWDCGNAKYELTSCHHQ